MPNDEIEVNPLIACRPTRLVRRIPVGLDVCSAGFQALRYKHRTILKYECLPLVRLASRKCPEIAVKWRSLRMAAIWFRSMAFTIVDFPCRFSNCPSHYNVLRPDSKDSLALRLVLISGSFVHSKPEKVRNVVGRKRLVDVLAHYPCRHRLKPRDYGQIVTPDMSALWTILDTTPEGRGTDWYRKLDDK